MGSFHSFAHELEKKIRKEIQAELSQDSSEQAHSPRSSGTGNSGSPQAPTELWSFLVGNLDPVRFQAQTLGQAYHGQKKPVAPRPPHSLNALQIWAVDFFAQRDVTLSPRFSAKDLQSAFRKLALRMHPDQGGSPIEFQNLMTARSELAQLF